MPICKLYTAPSPSLVLQGLFLVCPPLCGLYLPFPPGFLSLPCPLPELSLLWQYFFICPLLPQLKHVIFFSFSSLLQLPSFRLPLPVPENPLPAFEYMTSSGCLVPAIRFSTFRRLSCLNMSSINSGGLSALACIWQKVLQLSMSVGSARRRIYLASWSLMPWPSLSVTWIHVPVAVFRAERWIPFV